MKIDVGPTVTVPLNLEIVDIDSDHWPNVLISYITYMDIVEELCVAYNLAMQIYTLAIALYIFIMKIVHKAQQTKEYKWV